MDEASGGGSRARCELHGLAVGPDGKCVLCRREAGDSAQPESQPRLGWTGTLLVIGGGLLAALAAGKIAWSVLTRDEPQTPEVVSEAPRPMVPPAPGRNTPSPARDPDRFRFNPVAPAQPGDSATRPDPAPAAPTRDPRAVQRGREPEPLTQRDVMEAARSVPITMYAADWCPHCRRAREWFRASGIRYTDRDVERNAAAILHWRSSRR